MEAIPKPKMTMQEEFEHILHKKRYQIYLVIDTFALFTWSFYYYSNRDRLVKTDQENNT